jgi:hypothetical protein
MGFGVVCAGRRFAGVSALGTLLMTGLAAPAAAQSKLASGFYYPVTAYWPVQCSAYLERDAAHGGCYATGYYHLGSDFVSPLDSPVYALAAGTVVAKQSGWGSGTVGVDNIAVLIQHTLSDGSKFVAVYGHVHSSLNVGDTVLAGAAIATIGAWPTMAHLHLGIIPGTTIPQSYLGSIPNAYWPSTNGFTDPIQWLSTRSPATATSARLTVSVSGGGKVTSLQPGISCGAGATACAADYLSGSSVTLSVTPSAGWTFSGWSGSCTGTSACVVTMTSARAVTATFTQTTSTAGVFQKTGPVNAGMKQLPATILSWSPSANATSYEYCVDTTNNSACDATWVNVGLQTTAAPPGLALGVAYYWQVRARTSSAVTDADGGVWWQFKMQTSTKRFVCDVNYDGRADLLWQRSTDGLVAAWLLAGTAATGASMFPADPAFGTAWKVVGLGDFNADNACDLLFQNQTDGRLTAWMMDSTRRWGVMPLTPSAVTDRDVKVRAVADINGDGYSDLIWQRESTGQVSAWLMNGTSRADVLNYSPQQETDLGWKIVGAGDMNEDGHPDLLWQHQQTNAINIWVMNGPLRQQSRSLGTMPAGWVLAAVGDTNWDARPELILHNPVSGELAMCSVRSFVITQAVYMTPSANPDKTWVLVGPR